MHLPRAGSAVPSRSSRATHCVSLVGLQRPDGPLHLPPIVAFADFCAITPGVVAGRAARRVEGRCRFVRSGWAARPGAGYLVSRVNRFRVVPQSPRTADAARTALQAASGQPARPFARRQQSPGLIASGLRPGRRSNCRCTSAAFAGVLPSSPAWLEHRTSQEKILLHCEILICARNDLKSGDPSDQTLAFFERAAPPSPLVCFVF